MLRDTTRRGWPALFAAAVGLIAASVGLGALAGPARAQDVLRPEVGQTVVSEYRTGKVELLDADGKVVGTLAEGLSVPRGVLVLRDGSVVIAEYGGGRLVGTGGRFGPGLKEIAKLTTPEGLGYGLDGSVYATSLNEGTVVKVDVDSGTLTTVATGLKGPGDVVVRAGVLYVPEGTGGDVVAIRDDGTKTVFATGFTQPLGISLGPGKTLFVADYATGKVSQLDESGASTEFASLQKPVQIAIEPFTPKADDPYVLSVAAETGVVRLDPQGKTINTANVPLPIGVAAVPAGEAPSSTTTTVAPDQPTTTTGGESPSTTRRRTRGGTTVPPGPLDEGTGAGTYLLVALVVLVAGAGVVALYVRFGPKRGSAEAGFEEQPLDIVTVTEAFGPCAGEEVALAEAEGAVRSVLQQREAAERREGHAREAVEVARAGLEQARRGREAAEQLRLDAVAAGTLESPERRPVAVDDLALHTEEGRVVFAAFERGELDAETLERRWTEIGEDTAVAVFRAEDERLARSDPDGPWPEEVAAQGALEEAEERLEVAERDLAEAHADIERFHEREAEALERMADAKQRLADCQAAHQAERREAARAAVRAELTTEPGAAALPARPAPPVEATDESDGSAVQSDGGSDEARTTEPTEPGEPAEPAEPAEPTEPTEPTELAEAVPEPAEPAEPRPEPTEPTASGEPAEAVAASTEPAVEPTGSATPDAEGTGALWREVTADAEEGGQPVANQGMFTEAERVARAQTRGEEPAVAPPPVEEPPVEPPATSGDPDEVARLVAEAKAAGRTETTRPAPPSSPGAAAGAEPLPTFVPTTSASPEAPPPPATPAPPTSSGNPAPAPEGPTELEQQLLPPAPPPRGRRGRKGRAKGDAGDDGPDDLTDELFKF